MHERKNNFLKAQKAIFFAPRKYKQFYLNINVLQCQNTCKHLLLIWQQIVQKIAGYYNVEVTTMYTNNEIVSSLLRNRNLTQ